MTTQLLLFNSLLLCVVFSPVFAKTYEWEAILFNCFVVVVLFLLATDFHPLEAAWRGKKINLIHSKNMCGCTLLPAYVKENQLLCGLNYCWFSYVTFSSSPTKNGLYGVMTCSGLEWSQNLCHFNLNNFTFSLNNNDELGIIFLI